MKEKILKIFAAFLALALCIAFGMSLTMYTKPMEDVSLDLSLMAEDGAGPEDYDDKGWFVFTQKGDIVTELEPDNFGGFLGTEPGETFYYSRILEEELDSPTLQFWPINRTFSIWLDETLIYTDHPELDNRIGYLTLPMNEWDRTDTITISLPLDYQGKTLTIAQSTPEISDVFSETVYPAGIRLYCGYAYESELIAESFQTSIAATLLFLIGVILLILMVQNLDLSMICLSLIAFLGMVYILIETSFFYTYFETTSNTHDYRIYMISVAALLLFLTLRAEKHRKISFGLIAVYIITTEIIHGQMPQYDYFTLGNGNLRFFLYQLPDWLAFLGLVSTIIFSILFWRKESYFYQIFCWLAPAAVLLCWICQFLTDPQETLFQLNTNLQSGSITYICYRILLPVAVVTILTAIIDALKTEVDRRAEKQLLENQQELTLASYKNLRRQNEEVMMIRHDMMKHFHALHGLSTEEQVQSYLEEIIGQNQEIRPVVETGNNMLDIILNSKIAAAADTNIKVNILKASAPAQLPLADADLCSLLMNIMDNAITAAAHSTAKQPWIRLDIHEKNDYLVIICENSANIRNTEKVAKKETVQKHGLGLKIVKGITERYHGLFETASDTNYYKIQVVLPLL